MNTSQDQHSFSSVSGPGSGQSTAPVLASLVLLGFALLVLLVAAPAAAVGPSLIDSTSTSSLGTLVLAQERTRGRTGVSSRSTQPSNRATPRSAPRAAPQSPRASNGRGRTGVAPGTRYERPQRTRGHYRDGRRYNYRGGYYRGYHYPRYYPYFFSSYWWGYPGYYYGSPYAYRSYRESDIPGADMGALDMDVRPEEAEIYINGEYVGIADQFDGFPRYLWLEEGTYRVVLYREGYRTTAREFDVKPGVVFQVKTKMEKGETVPAESLFQKPTRRAEQRERDDRERRRAAQERRPYREVKPERGEDWRERRGTGQGQAPKGERPTGETSNDFRGDPAYLVLDIEPSDAAVYLDGRLLGSARELRSLHSALLIDPGKHVLEVVRPGYDSETERFEAKAGEEVEVEIELDDE